MKLCQISSLVYADAITGTPEISDICHFRTEARYFSSVESRTASICNQVCGTFRTVLTQPKKPDTVRIQRPKILDSVHRLQRQYSRTEFILHSYVSPNNWLTNIILFLSFIMQLRQF